jgi:4-alpha-glucanotransferase
MRASAYPHSLPPGYRGAGVLLHVTSLPSRHGIGDFGPSAFTWIDRLHDAGQQWWQGLPVGPTGWGDSPYQPLSSFAGNGLLLSPDRLVEEGLLQGRDCEARFPALVVDYETVVPFKERLLEEAWRRFSARTRPDLETAFEEFCARQAGWLDDYALFRALKARHQGRHYLQWPAELVERLPAAMARARHEAAEEIQRVRFAQFLLSRQASALEAHAQARGIRLIGDLPFFVSPDSSDVWAHPELFLLDAERRPRAVAGVPPDAFCSEGQLWGNPVYDWDALRATGYRWWIDRVRALLAHVDLVRLDHFRGFAAAWHVPAGAATAQSGQWVPGPGAELFSVAARELGGLPFIAEDLGVITPDVVRLRDDLGVPGTRVLQFAFDGDRTNPHLPHSYPPNVVVYPGTHDNPTTRGWYDGLPEEARRRLWSYLQRPPGESRDAAPALLALAWSSAAAVAIAPFQDVLNLGDEARMNVPGRSEGNWRWRCTGDTLSPPVFESLHEVTVTSRRARVTTDRPRVERAAGVPGSGAHPTEAP